MSVCISLQRTTLHDDYFIFSVLPCILKCLWVVEKGYTVVGGTVDGAGRSIRPQWECTDVIKGRKVRGNFLKIRSLLVKK